MSLATKQILIAVLAGLLLLATVIRLAHRRQLSFRYAVGWIGISMIGVLSGVFVLVVEPIAKTLGLSSAGLVGLLTLAFVTIISIQLSISISGLQRQLRSLAQEMSRITSKSHEPQQSNHHEE